MPVTVKPCWLWWNLLLLLSVGPVVRSRKETPSFSVRHNGPEEKEGIGGGIKLDLSGQYECLVAAGPDAPSPSSSSSSLSVSTSSSSVFDGGDRLPLTPIYRWKTRSRFLPSVTIGTQYSLAKAWYGATRLFGTLCWDVKADGIQPLQSQSKGVFPRTLQIGVEQGLTRDASDVAARLHLRWDKPWSDEDKRPSNRYTDAPDTSTPSFHMRINNMGFAQASVDLPVHERFSVTYRRTWLPPSNEKDMDELSTSHFGARLPPSKDPEWWLPKITADPTGRVTSVQNMRWKDRYGMRLVFKRSFQSIGWSLGLGGIDEQTDGETAVSLLLTGLIDPSRTSCTYVRADALLERFRESIRCSLMYENRCPSTMS